MRQGQSRDGTPRKEAGFRMLLRQNLRMTTSPAMMPYPYWHIDLNAGCGWNELADCHGSPLVFLDAAVEVGRPFRAMFCDEDAEAIGVLRGRVRPLVEGTDPSGVHITCQDNSEALRAFSRWIDDEERNPGKAIGSWLCDPNGAPGTLLLERLKEFCQRHERIDAILNLNVSLFARVRGCKGNPNTPGFDDWPDPTDVLGLRPFKTHWLVRNPSSYGGERFVMFIGRNTDRGMTKFEEFCPLDSSRGEEIVRTLRRIPPEQRLFWE